MRLYLESCSRIRLDLGSQATPNKFIDSLFETHLSSMSVCLQLLSNIGVERDSGSHIVILMLHMFAVKMSIFIFQPLGAQ